MKKSQKLLLIIMLIGLASCEKTDLYNPVKTAQNSSIMMANINAVEWQAEEIVAIIMDGKIKITGISENDEVLKLELEGDSSGSYLLSPLVSTTSYMSSSDGSAAPYQGGNSLTYNGSVYVNAINKSQQTITGVFEFDVYRADNGLKRAVTNGVVKNIPYVTEFPSESWHSLSCIVDTVNKFTASEVTATDNGSLITLFGIENKNKGVQINFANNLEEGEYNIASLSSAYYLYDYVNDSTGLKAESGTLTISKHDQVLNIIEGSFNFEVEGYIDANDTTIVIENGQFAISYF